MSADQRALLQNQRPLRASRLCSAAMAAVLCCAAALLFAIAPARAYAENLAAASVAVQDDSSGSADSSESGGSELFKITASNVKITDADPLYAMSGDISAGVTVDGLEDASSYQVFQYEPETVNYEDLHGIERTVVVRGDGKTSEGMVRITYWLHWAPPEDAPKIVDLLSYVTYNYESTEAEHVDDGDEDHDHGHEGANSVPIAVILEDDQGKPLVTDEYATVALSHDGNEIQLTGKGEYADSAGRVLKVGYRAEELEADYNPEKDDHYVADPENGLTSKDWDSIEVNFGLTGKSAVFTGQSLFASNKVSVTLNGAKNGSTESATWDPDSYSVTVSKVTSSGSTTNGAIIRDVGTYKISIAPTTAAKSNGFSGSATKTFRVYPRPLSDKGVALTFSTLTYTGAAQSPTPTVTIDGTTINGSNSTTSLVKGTDYTITYANNINAGTATATVVGSNNLTGTKTFDFTISPREITAYSPYVSWGTVSYTGSAIQAVPSTVTYYGTNTVTLQKDKDYTLTGYQNNVNAGTATVTMKGIGNFTGEQTKTFTISAASVANATVGSIAEKTYTGSAITPVPTVTVNGKRLVYNKDFTITYYSNTNVGTAYGYIYGKGNYSSSKYVYPMFTIVGKPMSKASVASIAAIDYTGTACMPQPEIKYGSTKLTQGSDYTLSYANNTNPGTATLTITGKGSYAGTVTKKFKIKSTGTAPKLTATKAGSGRVLLSWNPIYGATKYAVYEKMPDGSYNTLKDNCVYTYGSVSNLSATRTHRFLVRAYVNGKWSSKADKYLASIKPAGAVKPTVRGSSASDTSIQLTWAHVPGASFYAIYEREGSKGSFNLRTNTYTGTTALLTGLRKKGSYTYYVRALLDGKWSKATKADYVTVSPSDPNSPTVTAQAVAGKKGKVKLTWGKVRGATKYMVQAKAGNGKWKTYTKTCKKTTFTLAKLTSKKKYTFRVRAYANGKWSKLYSDLYVTATPD